jgi:hypothetical protein
MFERLLLCEYAVLDLTSANANVFYEQGVLAWLCAVNGWSVPPTLDIFDLMILLGGMRSFERKPTMCPCNSCFDVPATSVACATRGFGPCLIAVESGETHIHIATECDTPKHNATLALTLCAVM